MANKVEKVEVVIDFSFLGSQIPADNDYTHGIKMLTPWKKSCDKPRQCIKKQNITLPTKIWIDQAMVSPVIMRGCESWTIKMAEC